MLFLDGLVQTTERDEFFYHEMLVHPAMACHPSARSVLIIGGGDGGALNQVLVWPVRRATLVEIDAEVVAACRRHFPWLRPSLRDPRAELVLADGDEFLTRTDRTFDVILVDSSDPVGPSAVLHRKGFFTHMKKRLSPTGVIAAQSGSLLHHLDTFRKKNSFLNDLFKVVRFYIGPAPTYPGGTWCYTFMSDAVDPLAFKHDPPPGLRYYNAEVHRAAFALPSILKDALD